MISSTLNSSFLISAVMHSKILLHICCAPCACFPLKVLKAAGYDMVWYWYNPNIHGVSEYRKRLMALGYLGNKEEYLDIIEDKYDLESWFKKDGDYSKPLRCNHCYSIRLAAAARKARENKIKSFTTTLLYSKFQDHSMIKMIGEEMSCKYGVDFVYMDFRNGWKEGIEMSKEIGLYRQRYCGCLFSETENCYVS